MSTQLGEPVAAGIAVRDAVPDDNVALIDLAAACPMNGSVGLCMERSPDFFALNRLEGDRFRLGIVDGPGGAPVGCIAVSYRTAYIGGRPRPITYVGDLKVHPASRGKGVADALSRWAEELCVAEGADVPTLLTVLAGNRPMERRYRGPHQLPTVHRMATIRTFSVPLLWRRREVDGITVRSATFADLPAMAALWLNVAPTRNFMAVMDEDSLKRWIDSAEGLALNNYLLALDKSGDLLGFMALWDQAHFKQMRITSYTRGLAAFRAAFNITAPLVGGQRLPAVGRALRQMTATHVCVPSDRVDVLRALALSGYNRIRRSGYSFFNVGLDRTDPLTAAFKRMTAQHTDVEVCLAVQHGDTPMSLDGRVVHHEIALV